MPQLVRANAVGGPPPPNPQLVRANAVGGYLPVGQPQVLPPGGIFNPGRFRRNKSLRKSKPKKSTSKKSNRRM